MKVFEKVGRTQVFLLDLSPEQEEKIGHWLEQLKFTWNHTLRLMEEFIKFNQYDKVSKKYVEKCPMRWDYIYDSVSKTWVARSKLANGIRLIKEAHPVKIPTPKGKQEHGWGEGIGYACPIPIVHKRSLLCDGMSGEKRKIDSQGLKNWILQIIRSDNYNPYILPFVARQEMRYEKEISVVPYKYRQGLLRNHFVPAWEGYRKGDRKHPKYKRKHDNLSTLLLSNGVNAGKRPVNIQDNWITGIPGLGKAYARGLQKRWGNIPIQELKIVHSYGKFYIHLFAEFEKGLKVAKKSRACGIDPGVKVALSLDNNKTYSIERRAVIRSKTETKYNQKIASKAIQRLILFLNHPNTNADDITEISNLGVKTAQELLDSKPKDEKQILDVISASTLNRIKFSLQSNRDKKIRERLAKYKRKSARQRKAEDDKITTFIASTYHAVAFEKTNVRNMTKKAAPKESEDGTHYEHNNKSAKSGLNKALLDNTFGRKRELVKKKVEERRGLFYPATAKNSSRTCPVCGNKKVPDTDRILRCDKCGYECDRDINAGINFVLQMYDKQKIGKHMLSENALKALELRERRVVKSK